MAAPLTKLPVNLTPAVITKLPLGLLAFFGIKNGGSYPQHLSELIAPTLELLPNLAANYNENLVGYIAAAAGGYLQPLDVVSGLALAVPNSELWYCSGYGVNAIAGAGENTSFSGIVRNSQSGGTTNGWAIALTERMTMSPGLTQFAPGFGFPRWFGPNDLFQIYAETITGGTIDFNVQMRISRFAF